MSFYPVTPDTVIRNFTADDIWVKVDADGKIIARYPTFPGRQYIYQDTGIPIGQETAVSELDWTYPPEEIAKGGWYKYIAEDWPEGDVVNEVDAVYHPDDYCYHQTYSIRAYTEEELADLLTNTIATNITSGRNFYNREASNGVPFTYTPPGGGASQLVHIQSTGDTTAYHIGLVQVAKAALAASEQGYGRIYTLEGFTIPVDYADVEKVVTLILKGADIAVNNMLDYFESVHRSTHFKSVPTPPDTFMPSTPALLDLTDYVPVVINNA